LAQKAKGTLLVLGVLGGTKIFVVLALLAIRDILVYYTMANVHHQNYDCQTINQKMTLRKMLFRKMTIGQE
jgi:hypothetical protein